MKSPTPTLPSSETIYYPTDLGEVKERKDRFAKMLAYISEHHGWVVSVPGAEEIMMECLPGSTLPDDLMAAGYDVVEAGQGERILPAMIVERFARRGDGRLEPITAASTWPVAETRTHAGITRVLRYAFSMI